MNRRRLLLGVVAAAAYVAAAVGLAGNGPVLPLYDGNLLPPEPYRWVNPPPDLAGTNVSPEPTRQEVALTESGSVSASIVTADSQAALVVRDGSFAARLGEIAVIVEITPLDPETIGSPPAAVGYDGNAYRITATYAKDGAEAVLTTPVTVVLRSPLGGTRLLRRDGSTWTEISAQPVAASLQVFGETTQLGTFVAGQTIHPKGPAFPWLPVSLGASGVAAIAAWFSAAHLRRRKSLPRRDRRAAARGKTAPRRPAPRRRKR
ncbi:MAG: hypothetical protein ACRDKS_10285 [Actinomycetota bacterium]